jgi:hypothetical protein
VGGGGEAATELDIEDRRDEGGFMADADGIAGVPGIEAEGVSGPAGTPVETLAAESSTPWSEAAESKTEPASDMAVLSWRAMVGRADEVEPKDGCRDPPWNVSRSDRP